MTSAVSADASVRVLIVAPAPLDDPRSGGIANFIRTFIEFMPAGFEVEVVGAAVGNDMPGAYWREIEIAERTVRFLPVARLPEGRRRGRVPAKARIVAGLILHRRRIDTRGRVGQIHAPGMSIGLARRGLPLIRVVHNAPEDLANNPGESLWGRFSWLLGPLERRAFGEADVFFVNRRTRDEYAARLPAHAARLHYMPLAIDRALFRVADETERSQLRASFGADRDVPTGARWVLFAGRLDQQKDPLLAVRVFAELTRLQGEDAYLIVVGDGRLRADMSGAARALGVLDRVRFIGTLPRAELAVVMRAADVFILTSEFEAGPFVVLEALASGLPVVSTRVGEVPKYVRHGETGWITDQRAPRELAQAVRWALAQERPLVAQRAAESVASFDPQATLQTFYEAHRRLSERGARGESD